MTWKVKFIHKFGFNTLFIKIFAHNWVQNMTQACPFYSTRSWTRTFVQTIIISSLNSILPINTQVIKKNKKWEIKRIRILVFWHNSPAIFDSTLLPVASSFGFVAFFTVSATSSSHSFAFFVFPMFGLCSRQEVSRISLAFILKAYSAYSDSRGIQIVLFIGTFLVKLHLKNRQLVLQTIEMSSKCSWLNWN